MLYRLIVPSSIDYLVSAVNCYDHSSKGAVSMTAAPNQRPPRATPEIGHGLQKRGQFWVRTLTRPNFKPAVDFKTVETIFTFHYSDT